MEITLSDGAVITLSAGMIAALVATTAAVGAASGGLISHLYRHLVLNHIDKRLAEISEAVPLKIPDIDPKVRSFKKPWRKVPNPKLKEKLMENLPGWAEQITYTTNEQSHLVYLLAQVVRDLDPDNASEPPNQVSTKVSTKHNTGETG